MRIRMLLICAVMLPAPSLADHHADAVAAVIDDFHAAAAHGDKERYLGHMTDDAVFMGTDEWERWPKEPEFRDYVDSRFKDGSGWNYRSVERKIRIADSGNLAWFDEVVFSEQNGRFRGTGVLTLQDGHWKIAHYAMSFLIFNEDWPAVIELSRQTAKKKATETQ